MTFLRLVFARVGKVEWVCVCVCECEYARRFASLALTIEWACIPKNIRCNHF